MSITIIKGSILEAETDTIVNPANSFLQHAGGLARVIANAAAPAYQNIPYEHSRFAAYINGQAFLNEQALHPNIPTGAAGWTSAGVLPYKGIVHAVGPIWGGGEFYEHELLYEAHESAFKVASEQRCASIAFPAISCGIFGFPVDQAALTAVDSMRTWDLDIQVYLMEDAHVEAYENALDCSYEIC